MNRQGINSKQAMDSPLQLTENLQNRIVKKFGMNFALLVPESRFLLRKFFNFNEHFRLA